MTAEWFVTDAGARVPAITAEQMREVDRIAIEELGPNLYQMMENAGRSLATMILERFGHGLASTPVTVLAGTGGNGGGGICAARHLANHGAEVTLIVTDPARLTPVPSEQLRIYRATSGMLRDAGELESVEPGLIVDAVIGYSLQGTPRGVARRMIEWTGSQEAPVIALDVPSGIDSTTGQHGGAYVRATSTLTLALPKTGLDSAAVGDLWLADLGIPAEVYRRLPIEVPPQLFNHRFTLRLQRGHAPPLQPP